MTDAVQGLLDAAAAAMAAGGLPEQYDGERVAHVPLLPGWRMYLLDAGPGAVVVGACPARRPDEDEDEDPDGDSYAARCMIFFVMPSLAAVTRDVAEAAVTAATEYVKGK